MTGKSKTAILGSGAWGTAIAHLLAEKGGQTVLWGRDQSRCDEINTRHENTAYLPGIALSPKIHATADLNDALCGATKIMLVVPAQTAGRMAQTIATMIEPGSTVIVCAKGIDRQTGKLAAETVAAVMPGNPVACLSGPSFASDVARNLPTAVTLACNEMALATELASELSGPAFRVYASDDLRGVELGGALKNVIAVAVGVCRGMGLGASAEAALIARGFAEMVRLASKLGAKKETLMGLSGLGDLVLTCSSTQSRNFAYGAAIGSGKPTAGLALAEGAFTAGVAAKIASDNNLDCPVVETVAKLVDGTLTPAVALGNLLARPLKTESD